MSKVSIVAFKALGVTTFMKPRILVRGRNNEITEVNMDDFVEALMGKDDLRKYLVILDNTNELSHEAKLVKLRKPSSFLIRRFIHGLIS